MLRVRRPRLVALFLVRNRITTDNVDPAVVEPTANDRRHVAIVRLGSTPGGFDGRTRSAVVVHLQSDS